MARPKTKNSVTDKTTITVDTRDWNSLVLLRQSWKLQTFAEVIHKLLESHKFDILAAVGIEHEPE